MTEMESAVIVAAMLDPECTVGVDLGAEHFSCYAGQKIWGEILKGLSIGQPIDGIRMQAALKGDLVAMKAFGEAMRATASPKNIQHYAAQVLSDAKLRHVRNIASGILADRDSDASALAGRLVTELMGIDEPGRQHEYSAQQLMARTLERIDAASTGQQLGLKTGWLSLDTKLGGWHKGDLTIIAGRPGMGKSAFGMNAAMNASRLGARVGFVSVEMDAVSLGMRLAASAAGISVQSLRTGQVQDFDALVRATNEISKLPLRVLDAPGWTMGQIIRQCHAWHRSGLDMVVIDYLQRCKPDVKTDRHDLAIGSMAVSCKTMASTLEIPVLLLSQLSRNLESRADKRPMMSDLRESGQIEQEADNVIMLYRGAVYDDSVPDHDGEILVEKQRQGPIGMLPMIWDGARAQWKDGY